MEADNADFVLIKGRYPMFGASIQRLWGHKEFVTYLKELLVTVQAGASSGTDSAVAEALQRIAALHDQEFPQFIPHARDNPAFQAVNAAFPAIGAKLTDYWGSKDFGPYMTGLLQNDRGSSRKGFPFEILMALHTLAELHNKDYGHLFPTVDIWTQMGT